jgi:hypothetical protein
MNAPLPDDQYVSAPLDEDVARERCEEAAEMLVNKHARGGSWRWTDARSLCVYRADGAPFATLSMEALS